MAFSHERRPLGEDIATKLSLKDFEIGPNGEVLDLPKNKPLIADIEKRPNLNPHQILRMAARLSQKEATQGLAFHLAKDAMRAIARDPKVNHAIEKIRKEPISWSFFDDLWNSIVNFFTGPPGNPPAGSPGGAPPGGTPYPCEVKCWAFVLVERCWTGPGDTYGPWHIIGACFFGTF